MASKEETDCPTLDFHIDPEKVDTEFFQVLEVIRPQWEKDHVVFNKSELDLTKGLLNTMVKCYSRLDPEDAIMVRIHNVQVSQFLERSVEITCIKHLHKMGCAPKILAVFKNGFCYQYIHGEILSCDRLSEEPIWRLIAEQLAMINSAKIYHGKHLTGETNIEKMMEMMWAGYPDELPDPEKNRRFKTEIPDKEYLKKEIDFMREHVKQFNPTVVLTHNDTRAENIIWNKEKGVISFVDFEAMNYGYQASEIASHFSRYEGLPVPDHSKYPSEEFQMKWLRVYLEKFYECTGRKRSEVTDKDIRRLYIQVCKYYLLLLIISGMAGPAMESKTIISIDSVDFLGFTISNLEEYHKRKEEILKLEMPPE